MNNIQTYQPLPIYHNFHRFPTNVESLGPRVAAPETAALFSPLTMEQPIGSMESLPTNKATNVRNDGSVARLGPKRVSCHLNVLEARTYTDMTDNTFNSTNNAEKQQAFSTTGNLKFVTDPAFESPLLRKIKGSKAQTSDQDAAVTKNHTSTTQNTSNSIKLNHKPTKDKSVELYKTEWCRNWQELGVCRYGKKCRYAHSASELRKIERHPRYKTQICRTYHEKGTCPYGVRCTFIHEQQSMANPNIYHHQQESTANRNSTHTALESQDLKQIPSGAAKPDAVDEHRTASLSWAPQPGSNFTAAPEKPNETMDLMPLSQMKNVTHSRSASNASSCWSPTLPGSIWGHRAFQSEVEPTIDFAKRQKRSSSIASTSSFDSSIFAGDENSPELDRPTIYSQDQTGYISPIEDALWSEFRWMSLKPDMLKRHTAACLTVDL